MKFIVESRFFKYKFQLVYYIRRGSKSKYEKRWRRRWNYKILYHKIDAVADAARIRCAPKKPRHPNIVQIHTIGTVSANNFMCNFQMTQKPYNFKEKKNIREHHTFFIPSINQNLFNLAGYTWRMCQMHRLPNEINSHSTKPLEEEHAETLCNVPFVTYLHTFSGFFCIKYLGKCQCRRCAVSYLNLPVIQFKEKKTRIE